MPLKSRHLYFGYGNNSNPMVMAQRLPKAEFVGLGYALDWALTFAKPTLDGWAAATIQPSPSIVWGALWQIEEDDFKILDKIETGYYKGKIEVFSRSHDCFMNAVTYFARSLNPYILPSAEYITNIQAGMKEMRAPTQYQDGLYRLPFMTVTNKKKISPVNF